MQCNWKFAVDNLFDWYHPMLSHASAIQVGVLGPPKRGGGQPGPNPLAQVNLVMLGEFGHATAGPLSFENPDGEKVEIPGFDETWRERPAATEAIPPGVIKT